MSTYTISEREQKRAENIRRQYIRCEDSKMEQLQKLDHKAKAPGKMVASILGVIGALVMGAGMSMVMVWGEMTLGLIFSIPGLIVALMAYPVYALITNRRKKKYAAEIMRLSDAVIAR